MSGAPDGTERDPNAAPERDDATHDMFAPGGSGPSAPLGAAAGAYTVLARKYRPRAFEDLIGQDSMVRTLANAFATGRIAHAFMLTGVRGVGKTTTARLLARALNYERDGVPGPSVDLTVEGRHCRSIIEGRHIDVLELDAASRTRVDEMRELLDGVRYAPVEARFKVYVIDEVHMLSTAAFNALLKTLEEPPPHAKFIFATTEIRKVPVTILSRTQRFDLRRVEPEVLAVHLERIARVEGAVVETEGLALIARAAEGSVRDGLSLLDQALVQADRGATVRADDIRDMLGLADRAETIALFEAVMAGDLTQALGRFRRLYAMGADPAQVMNDLLEHAHAASVARSLGPEATRLPVDQARRMAALGTALSMGVLSRAWQMLLKAYEETRRAPDPAAAAEMALIRLAYAAELPGPEEVLRRIQSASAEGAVPAGPAAPNGPGPGGAAARAVAVPDPRAASRPAPTPAPRLERFEDVVALIEDRRDIALRLDVAQYMRPVAFRPGAVTFEPAPGCPPDLGRRLASRLKEWTGTLWLVAAEGQGGGETLYERERREQGEVFERARNDPFVRSLFDAFPGAELLAVRAHGAGALPGSDGAAGPEGEGGDDD